MGNAQSAENASNALVCSNSHKSLTEVALGNKNAPQLVLIFSR